MYYLFKSDPDEYGIQDLEKDKTTIWDGVHNNQAILYIQQTKIGDKVFIYHSLSTKAIVGLAEVIDEPFLNTNDPRRSWAVKIKFVKKFQNILKLGDIKQSPICKDFKLVTNSRLSVMPVTTEVKDFILANIS